VKFFMWLEKAVAEGVVTEVTVEEKTAWIPFAAGAVRRWKLLHHCRICRQRSSYPLSCSSRHLSEGQARRSGCWSIQAGSIWTVQPISPRTVAVGQRLHPDQDEGGI